MKVLLVGAGGRLGIELGMLLPERGYEVVALERRDLDLTHLLEIRRVLGEVNPELVVNAAAYTDVDGCETEVEHAYAVNALGPRNLAQCCANTGAELLHIGTNYVFNGDKDTPYEPFDLPDPRSVYAKTKLAGEEYVRQLSSRWYIVRTAGIYGEGRNFVRTMLRVGRERGSLRVKDDEYISPTYARDLAVGIEEILESGQYGTYHVTNSGACSWYEFACEIFTLSGMDVEVEPVPSSEYPLPADRPANGVLGNTGSPKLRPWREALEEYLLLETQQDQRSP